MSLRLTRTSEEGKDTIIIDYGNGVKGIIKVIEVKGGYVRLGLEVPREYDIHREGPNDQPPQRGLEEKT